MIFEDEASFEEAVIKNLQANGWDDAGGVLKYPTEQDLIDNWARILFENNNDIDRLNGCPLTSSEMAQILEQVTTLRTPLALNGFINGKTVAVLRDNTDDTLHCGKEVSLKIYDRREIAAGQSRYQIAQQPIFSAKRSILNDRRGDLMLLINGMPVIHIELKKTGVPVAQAVNQINKYLHEGVFTGLFGLVQIFTAMTPEETLYFASPGTGNVVNERFCFHWADFNNEPIDDWKAITSTLLCIPMAHQLIGFYTVADDSDGALKVMRSYQYYAANAISDKVAKVNIHKRWGEKGLMGGYIWHTTGSGKTMTSFKCAQLIANSRDADKVVFLVDRIELGTQSLNEYRAFSEENDSVQETRSTDELRAKLKSGSSQDVLIVTSIQKMSRIHEEDSGLNTADLEAMRRKRIVFIVDECHRSTFGDMLRTIKETFPDALFFGFTGTPIHDENAKKMNTTTSVFGDELHRYSIADGIRDGNVLGFDPDMVCTFRDDEVREAVALRKANAATMDEAVADERKSEVLYWYLNTANIGMAGEQDENGVRKKGIEDFIPTVQYEEEEHRNAVVEDIAANWLKLSRGGKFHALFATSCIPDAIEYYRLLKERLPEVKTAALFDPNVDNTGGAIYKEDGLVEIIEDYNARYGKDFSLRTHAGMKKDIAARLAHKKPHLGIENRPDEQIDLLIVVDQMLTGFDSKWINTLYLDKVLEYAPLIQAFSRTNRLFKGDEKPFGTIRYYRRPHTMANNIKAAVKLYSGDKPFGLFVDKLLSNILTLNGLYQQIEALFVQGSEVDFSKLPETQAQRAKFAKCFNEFHATLEAAKIQGFTWEQSEYEALSSAGDGEIEVVQMACTEETFHALQQRYKELSGEGGGGGGTLPEAPYDLRGYLVTMDTGLIDTAYMNENFTKWLKALSSGAATEEELESLRNNLHRSFASLSQEDQRYAEMFLRDIERGEADVEEGKTLRDYITSYASRAKTNQVKQLVDALGVDAESITRFLEVEVTAKNINEYGRFVALKETVDKNRARAYFEKAEGQSLTPPKVSMRVDSLLRKFLISGGFDLDQ